MSKFTREFRSSLNVPIRRPCHLLVSFALLRESRVNSQIVLCFHLRFRFEWEISIYLRSVATVWNILLWKRLKFIFLCQFTIRLISELFAGRIDAVTVWRFRWVVLVAVFRNNCDSLRIMHPFYRYTMDTNSLLFHKTRWLILIWSPTWRKMR